ncbi:MAG: hypothetical protein LBD23_04045 [Oscillospiraceae bacterium]|jgi:hypothetical protein|nr:hypothetical protein [Oscillospiraceae bacterium]
MLDINKELNDIILKYNIDRQYYRFRKSLKAIDLLNRLVTEYDNIIFVGVNDTDLKTIRQDIDSDKEFEYLQVKVNDKNAFDNISDSKTVVIASYNLKHEIASFLLAKDILHICLYDYFMLNGLNIEHDYYNIFGQNHCFLVAVEYLDWNYYNPYNDIVHDNVKLSGSYSFELKKIYYERIIFKLFYIKDFVSVEKYIAEYLSLYSENTIDYAGAWAETSTLLDKIKKVMSERKEKDIVMLWLDMLERGFDNENMPFLKGISEKALVFENAYTVAPYTSSTLRTIFTKTKPVDDASFKIKNIAKENSPLIKNLELSGIGFRYYGYSNIMDSTLKSKFYADRVTPSSIILWNAVKDMLNSDKANFYLLHLLPESHDPCLSVDLDYSDIYNYGERLSVALRYLDKQLKFYSTLLPEKSVKIYMSDHGRTTIKEFQPILKVVGEKIHRKTETRLFSYIDFDKLIRYIVCPEDFNYNELFRDFAEIQDIDHTSGSFLMKRLSFFAEQVPIRYICGRYSFAYRGVITEDDIYIRYNDGREFYRKHRNDGILFTVERLEYLREITGTKKCDIENEDIFKYSRYLYKILEKYHTRVGDYEERKTAVLQKLFTDLENVNAAIYIGGNNCLYLLQRVGPEYFKNINYIIDTNPDCLGSKMGIPVIELSQTEKYNIDLIVTINFQNQYPSSELDGLNCKIINIYDYLEEHGVKCTRDFWYYEFEKEDFDIGFPKYEVLKGELSDYLGVKL